ncbi:hypothetical protein BYT27DRAFT_7255981 [Phlegmacium glaucopus]|nr:hypothetical protein BYT27DRAFT_7255981 [Phlegmacium glaucopus]
MDSIPPQSLNFLSSSPVRGQLEPYDPRTPKGCRYIQVTDTPDELKVLLPPGTGSMYEQLLKLENYELTKKPTISWERIMEIRHLKDRMVRKCRKLAKMTLPVSKRSSRDDSFAFQTFVAPADFRVKEMEKWFRDQQQRLPRRPTVLPGIPTNASGPSSAKYPIHRSFTNPEQSIKQRPMPTMQPSRLLQVERKPSAPAAASPSPSILAGIMSPPPLPVLLLSHREEYGLDAPVEQLNLLSTSTSPPNAQEQQSNAAESNSRSLQRRPSCIKRNSIGEFKTVSWADNQEWDTQVDNYAAAAREAQASGKPSGSLPQGSVLPGKWDQVRVLYLEQIAGLENLHNQVKEGLVHLRSETDHLQRIDETIRKQRSILDATFQEFEQKQNLLQEKVQEALTEANDALMRNSTRRGLEPINENLT